MGSQDPCQASVEVAGHLDVHAGGLVLAGVQLGQCSPRPARQQGPIDDVQGALQAGGGQTEAVALVAPLLRFTVVGTRLGFWL